jgi:hypothetical protein
VVASELNLPRALSLAMSKTTTQRLTPLSSTIWSDMISNSASASDTSERDLVNELLVGSVAVVEMVVELVISMGEETIDRSSKSLSRCAGLEEDMSSG